MTSLEKFREIFSVNLYAPLAIIEALKPDLIRERKCSIINICSDSAIIADAGYTAYSSSKASLIEATKILASELGKYNIRVNAIAPGLTETDMGLGNKTDSDLCYIQENVAMRRFAKPEEIAETVLFLAGDKSEYINGETIVCNGGRTLM